MDTQSGSTPEIALNDLEDGDLEARIRRMMGNRCADAGTQLALADALFDKGDEVEAVRVLQLLIHRDPQYFHAYDRLVDTFTRLRRRHDAAETYHKWGLALSRRLSPQVTHPGPTDQLVVDSVASYYAIRAPEYDQTSGYMGASSAWFINQIAAELKAAVHDRDTLEIACGTGYWTPIAAEAARSVLATDRNASCIELVRRRTASAANVTCQVADAYTLEGVDGRFTAAFAQFWWSHMPRSQIRTFLTTLHSRLAPGADVFFMDSLPYLVWGPQRRLDEEGNVLEPRIMKNGDQYEVIKNFPTEAEIRASLEGIAHDIVFRAREEGSVWTVHYKAASL